MKYIIYKQPIKNDYPVEIAEEFYYSSGYILAGIEDNSKDTFDWKSFEAFEVSSDIASGALWSDCIIKLGQTERYLKWMPTDLGQTVPELSNFASGSTGGNVEDEFAEAAEALKHVLSSDEEDAGRDWNMLIMTLLVKDIFNKRFLSLNVSENKLEESLWSVQLAEAVAYSADNTAATPVLDILSAARGNSISDVVLKVISANDAYNIKVATLLAEQQVLEDKVKGVTTLDGSMLLRESLFGILTEAGLSESEGTGGLQREVEDTSYGVQF